MCAQNFSSTHSSDLFVICRFAMLGIVFKHPSHKGSCSCCAMLTWTIGLAIL